MIVGRRLPEAPDLSCLDLLLERAKEVQNVLLLRRAQCVETVDHNVGFRRGTLTATPVFVNRDKQIGRSAVMQEKEAPAKTPKGSGAEFVGSGCALRDTVGETRSNVV